MKEGRKPEYPKKKNLGEELIAMPRSDPDALEPFQPFRTSAGDFTASPSSSALVLFQTVKKLLTHFSLKFSELELWFTCINVRLRGERKQWMHVICSSFCCCCCCCCYCCCCCCCCSCCSCCCCWRNTEMTHFSQTLRIVPEINNY